MRRIIRFLLIVMLLTSQSVVSSQMWRCVPCVSGCNSWQGVLKQTKVWMLCPNDNLTIGFGWKNVKKIIAQREESRFGMNSIQSLVNVNNLMFRHLIGEGMRSDTCLLF